MKKWVVALAIVVFASIAISSLPSQTAHADGWVDTNIAIEQFDISMALNTKNEARITESIDVRFVNARSVFVRSLPLFQYVAREMDEKVTQMRYNLSYSIHSIKDGLGNRLKFDDIKENGFLFLEIGKDGSFMYPQGSLKTFVFDYTVKMGNDRIATFDEFYYNVVGTDWACSIANISWQVTFPTEITAEAHVYAGAYGESSVPTQTLNIDNQTLSGTYASLTPYEGITVRALLPQGYFSDVPRPDLYVPVIIGLAIAFAIAAFFIKLKHDTRFVATPVVEFVAPKNLDPCTVGYIFDGRVNNKDISSLIVYWANLGLLTITEQKKQITLTKTQNAQKEITLTSHEATMFNALFATSPSVTLKTINYALADAIQKAKVMVKTNNQDTYFDKKALGMQMVVALLGALCLGLPLGYAHWMLNTPLSWVAAGIAIVVGAALNFLAAERKFYEYSKTGKLIFMLGVLGAVVAGVMIFGLYITLNGETFGTPIALFVAATVSYVFSLFLTCHFSTRAQNSRELVNTLIGLKQFIQTAEKDRIEMLAMQDPQAFYHVLPFAYVLGVSDVWIKKFDGLIVANPGWLSSDRDINLLFTIMLFNRLNYNMQQIAVNRPSNNSGTGGGFGGGGFGGFSGGGFGGGGGFSR